MANTQQGAAAAQATEDQQTIERLKAELAEARAGSKSSEDGNSGGEYVVLVSVMTARMGIEANNVRRFVRGQKFVPPKVMSQETLDRLVAGKAIALDDGEPKQATTARIASRAAGADDDPAASPIVEHLPVALPTDDEVKAREAQNAADQAAEEKAQAATAQQAAADAEAAKTQK